MVLFYVAWFSVYLFVCGYTNNVYLMNSLFHCFETWKNVVGLLKYIYNILQNGINFLLENGGN